jgi:hypothetical protein
VSIQAIEWVIDYSQARGAAWQVAIGLANFASKDGTNAHPSLTTLSRVSRVSRPKVPECLRRLQELGEIKPIGRRESGTVVYGFPMRRGSNQRELVTTGNQRYPGGTEVVPVGNSAGSQGEPEPLITVNEPSTPHVAALNGRTTEAVERFKLVAGRRPPKKPLRVDVPALLRAFEDFSHLPDLFRHSIDCAEWLGSGNGLARKDAARTLRRWLQNQLERAAKNSPAPAGAHLASSRRDWAAYAQRQEAKR